MCSHAVFLPQGQRLVHHGHFRQTSLTSPRLNSMSCSGSNADTVLFRARTAARTLSRPSVTSWPSRPTWPSRSDRPALSRTGRALHWAAEARRAAKGAAAGVRRGRPCSRWSPSVSRRNSRRGRDRHGRYSRSVLARLRAVARQRRVCADLDRVGAITCHERSGRRTIHRL
jgi:hypothetical protein